MKMRSLAFAVFLLPYCVSAQTLTHADTLRGSVTPERAWWDARHYDLHVAFDSESKSLAGWNTITYEVLRSSNTDNMQIDLMYPLLLDSAVQDGQRLTWKQDGNAYFIQLVAAQQAPSFHKISLYYHGKPIEAIRPPWDGGTIWGKDQQGRPWISVACQGVGPSIWYPNKDHQYDEPDSAALHITCPKPLVGVGNGRLRSTKDNSDGTMTYTWVVTNPINNYNIIPYIGYYANFKEKYQGEAGPLDLDFWAMDYNLDKAKSRFLTDTPKMLDCFEHWFGPYPFYEDGYKLVESPHLGMEHQSAVAYGNGYQNGYRGRDLSATGVGLNWDFILVHESGHEWFGNNITTKDIADMWVHEGFTNYSETLYTGCTMGEEAATTYNVGCRALIGNRENIIGHYDVNQEGSGDMYYKGGSLLHTIRAVMDDDEKFRQILRGLNKTFWHQTVTTKQVEDYVSQQSGIDFSRVFDQYLRRTDIPVLDVSLVEKEKKRGVREKELHYRWTKCVPGFDLPLKVQLEPGKWVWIRPTMQRQAASCKFDKIEEFEVDKRFYVRVKR
ncbi:MAG: M1 family metallopeptidase [Saprospiraceae bacterium]|nr:M1 family metallopeptidase [Saprospiraceae bacterium]